MYMKWHEQRVSSDFHTHGIVPWAVEEVCYFCRYPASHKVGEEDIYDFHNLTAYVCCNHFWSTCRNEMRQKNEGMD